MLKTWFFAPSRNERTETKLVGDAYRNSKAAMERMGNQGVKSEPGEVSKPLSGQRKKLG